MKVSVITVVYNGEKYIRDCLLSVAGQTYSHVEHIIVDGSSRDSTLDIVNECIRPGGRVHSSPDRGIYDAMNKGFKLSCGDVCCFLNSDDLFFSSDVLERVVKRFSSSACDFVYGDLVICDPALKPFASWSLAGWRSVYLSGQIPHPCLFVRSSALSMVSPLYDHSYAISADLKLQLLLHRQGLTGAYLPQPLVLMRLGGLSTQNLRSRLNGLYESCRAFDEVLGFRIGFIFAIYKVFVKIIRLKHFS